MSNVITTSIENINKEKALEYLEKNIHNRKPTPANIDFLISEINNERFVLNGQAISFDTNGNLIDGQHRLIAISKTDKTVQVLVIRGLENDVFKTVDTGKNRSAADILSIKEVSNSNNIASAISRIIHKFHQQRHRANLGTIKISNTEIMEFYAQNKDELQKDITFVHSLYASESKIVTPAVACAMLYLLKRENNNKARSFIREIYTGAKETDDCSAITLRKKLINYKIEGFKLSDTNLRNLFLSAFRAYCNNKNLSIIKISNVQYFKEDWVKEK